MTRKMYQQDLAAIHDEGFGEFSKKSAPGLLKILQRHGICGGLVVDIGCGSGIWAQKLIQANYRVLGIDVSRAMIKIAQRKAPKARFRIESLYDAKIPTCAAVTAIGECLNYLSEKHFHRQKLLRFFKRVFAALEPGGVFIFDIAEPGQVPKGITLKTFTQTDRWTVLVSKSEKRNILERKITTFYKKRNKYRRSDEIHLQALFSEQLIVRWLKKAGFQARTTTRYGNFRLPPAHRAFIAIHPKLSPPRRGGHRGKAIF